LLTLYHWYHMRRKLRLKENKLTKLQHEHNKYNKEMRQIGCHKQQKTFDEYIAWKYGRYQPKLSGVTPKEEPVYRRPEQYVPSRNSGVFNQCSKANDRTYTGELITGLATMHKSNVVPIFNKDQAHDLATMRRG